MITLSEAYKPLDEGNYNFDIVSVDYDETFGTIKVKLNEQSSSQEHTERYQLLNNDGETIRGALWAFTMLARAALNDPDLKEVDESLLAGHVINADVEHGEYIDKKGNTRKTVHLRNVAPVTDDVDLDLDF